MKGGHVAIFGFPATSHSLPLFNLACKLARAAPEVHFSFFNSAKANSFLFSTHKNHLPTNLKPYALEDGVSRDHGTRNLHPGEEIMKFINAVPGSFKLGMDEAMKEAGKKVSCLVTDAFFSFAVGNFAEEMNVPWVSFWVPSPYSFLAHLCADVIEKQCKEAYGQGQLEDRNLEAIPGLSSMRIGDLPPELISNTKQDMVSPLLMTMTLTVHKASAVVFNSYEELNHTLLTHELKSRFRNVLYVGFLTVKDVPLPPLPSSSTDSTGCLPWLDEQKEASVIYISFGTVAALSREELVELAKAIEESGFPFLWSLNDKFKEHLPHGFLERTSTQGKVVPWAPQTQVLSHPSTGVHVTHSGYNSVGESILTEVPMICRSIWADNHMNARMVEELLEIGVRVEGGVISKDGMLESLKKIFQHEKGKKIRESIKTLKQLVLKAAGPDGSATNDFGTLLQVICGEH